MIKDLFHYLLFLLTLYFIQNGCQNDKNCALSKICVKDSETDAYGTCKVSMNFNQSMELKPDEEIYIH